MARRIALPVSARDDVEVTGEVRVLARIPADVGLERFKKNLVVLENHDGSRPPVGHAELAELDGIRARLHLHLRSGERARQLAAALRDTVVRFVELDVDDQGELVEMSLMAGPLTKDAELVEAEDTGSSAPTVHADGDAELEYQLGREHALRAQSEGVNRRAWTAPLAASRDNASATAARVRATENAAAVAGRLEREGAEQRARKRSADSEIPVPPRRAMPPLRVSKPPPGDGNAA